MIGSTGYRLGADAVLVAHLAFVGFVVFGAALVWRWPRLAWLHLPAVAWGAATEFFGIVCPLTAVENRLRALGGSARYDGSFIDHYLIAVLYPAGLTRGHQFWLGVLALGLNLLLYGWALARRNRQAA